jgi:hypothetical protein
MSYLRLSEAILAGDTLRSRNATIFLTTADDLVCPEGCAIGGAWMATSDTAMKDYSTVRFKEGSRALAMTRIFWPWVTHDHVTEVSRMFRFVCQGEITLEQLADRVREWEEELDPMVKREKDPAFVEADADETVNV